VKKEIGIIAGLKTLKCKDGVTRNMVFGESSAKKVKGVWIPKGGQIRNFDLKTFKQMKVGDKMQF
jgi:hypothetical protein